MSNEDEIFRLAEVKRSTGMSTSSIYRYMSEGEFPTPIKLGPRAVGWLSSEISAWKRKRITATRGSGH